MWPVMAVLCLGVSYRRAPLDLLERLAFSEDGFAKAYRLARDDVAIDEAVILSTCNRVELYAMVPAYHAGFLALKRVLAEARDVNPDHLAEPLYSHYERDAADHLFAVAAGLDSMVLGETQIAAQVREALRRAEAESGAGSNLNAFFHAASRAGRRVRAETPLGASPSAFVELGLDLAEEELGGLGGRRVLVVGAGHMAALAAKHLRRRGVGGMLILNRSVERAQALAARTDAEAADLRELSSALPDAALVVCATGASATVVRADLVRRAVGAHQPDRIMVLLDLAVPRDVDPGSANVPGVRLFDIETLRGRIEQRDDATAAGIARAHEIVAEEVRKWISRRRADELAPLLKALKARGDDVVRVELERSLPRLRDLTPDELDAVRDLARGIVAKLLHEPIAVLKERTDGLRGPHAKLLAELLGIDPE